MIKKEHLPFFISVFGGVLVWVFVFILFPAKVVSPFANESFWFIFLSYVCFVFGYFFYPNFKNKIKDTLTTSNRFIYFIILITLISYLVRYIDLFLYRKVSFNNDVWQNRALLDKTKPSFVFMIASVLKQLYFVPIIFIFEKKIKNKKLLFIAFLLFLLPFIEGFIRASRNSFFMPVILLFITLLYFKKLSFNRKHILIIISIVSVLFVIATSIIMKRAPSNSDENYSSFTTNFFLNKFLEPYPSVFKEIQSTKNTTVKKIKVSGFQIAQYYVHGVFEFDNLVKYYQKEPIKHQYGKYNLFVINKFTNKYGFTKTNLHEIQSINPRVLTFITFFGGLYIDFGWFGLLIMLLYGRFQRFVANNVFIKNNSYLPLFFFFLFCNFFMLTFNFIKSTGTYILVICFTLIFIVSLINKAKVVVR